ncbi:hypothetical protein MTO96_020622 [Rhipicephalus appendiculatus]
MVSRSRPPGTVSADSANAPISPRSPRTKLAGPFGVRLSYASDDADGEYPCRCRRDIELRRVRLLFLSSASCHEQARARMPNDIRVLLHPVAPGSRGGPPEFL